MSDSVRELLLSQIISVFSSATGASSGGGTVWARVQEDPYSDSDFKGKNVMSVVEGTETYIDVVSPDKRDRSLDIDLQTRIYVPMGTSLRKGANSALADIEEIIEANTLWGGLAYSTIMTANAVERTPGKERIVEISVFMTVRYRTKRTDPRSRT